MTLITAIPVNAIAEINSKITGRPVAAERLEKLKGSLGSYFYYEKPEAQAASIIYALIKDHFFIDGNKRTAFVTYMALAKINGLPFLKKPKLQADAFVWLAAECGSVEECARRLFHEN